MNTPFNLKPRWRKVLADLWDNKTRTLLVVSSIAVGVFSIGMIITAYAIMDNDIDVSYAAAEPATCCQSKSPVFRQTTSVLTDSFGAIPSTAGMRMLPMDSAGGLRVCVMRSTASIWCVWTIFGDSTNTGRSHTARPLRARGIGTRVHEGLSSMH
jgi:hypothetical protein